MCRVGFLHGILWSQEMLRDLASSPNVSFPFGVPHCVTLTSRSLISSLSAELSETPTLQHDTFKTCLTIKRDNLSEALANLSPHFFGVSGGITQEVPPQSSLLLWKILRKTYVKESFQTVRHPTEKIDLGCTSLRQQNCAASFSLTPCEEIVRLHARVHVLFITSRMPAPAGPESGTSFSCSVARFSNNGMVGRITALGGKGNIGIHLLVGQFLLLRELRYLRNLFSGVRVHQTLWKIWCTSSNSQNRYVTPQKTQPCCATSWFPPQFPVDLPVERKCCVKTDTAMTKTQYD